MPKILLAALPINGVFTATEAASQLTRLIRAHDRTLANDDVVQIPLVDGGDGTIDFLVTHSLGSFLEVEATGGKGDEVVVPLGFAGEDGKLAVIELARVANVGHIGGGGTTFGIGELIRDSLDEGAFSVLLGHEEPLAADAGLGAVAALGVKFLNAEGWPIVMNQPNVALSDICAVDAAGRSFELLSSRFFVGRAQSAASSAPTRELLAELERLSAIFLRDASIHASTKTLSASAVEFGLRAFLGAEVRDGGELVLEASRVLEAVASGDFETLFLFANDQGQLAASHVQMLLTGSAGQIKHVVVIFSKSLEQGEGALVPSGAVCHSLQDVKLFQAPVLEGASAETIRRDLLMRLEKLVPKLMAARAKPDVTADTTSVPKSSRRNGKREL